MSRKKTQQVERPVVLVVDGHNMIYRGYYAVKFDKSNAKVDSPTNAIKGFINIFMSDMKKVGATHACVVFDRRGKNFRHELYPEYKANRPKPEVDLHPQIRPLVKLLRAMGVKVYGVRGEEGDDVTATVAVKMATQGARVVIDSKDKDFAVLVKDGSIELLQPKAPKPIGEEGVFEQYGVYPKHMTEYLMLLGDGVDNIPGVEKCGPKTAAKWLNEYGSIKEVKRNIDDLTPKMRENFLEAYKRFGLTRKLIELKMVDSVNPTYDKLKMGDHDMREIEKICRTLAFESTVEQIKAFLGRQESIWG